MTIAHPSVKHRLVAASTQAFQSDGLSVSACLTDLAQHFGIYAEGGIDRLMVPSWQGPLKSALTDVDDS